ncbi:hypothetical protein PSTT_10951 [Puccinia striiformis]|uniref:Uncharacterized protein n=1 Tax=Puccinia striiformis TaxID=27350 RepID=A0A2S4V2B5_9BASI|nr:hypothetical protein PSTT_10951 [Puccinia striiformis]
MKMHYIASTILVLLTAGCEGTLKPIDFSCTNKSIPNPECYHLNRPSDPTSDYATVC